MHIPIHTWYVVIIVLPSSETLDAADNAAGETIRNAVAF